MNYRLLMLVFFLNIPIFGQEVPQELQTYLDQLERQYKTNENTLTTYSTDWYSRINTMLNGLEGFTKEDQGTITKEVSAVKKKLESEFVQVVKEVNSQYNNYRNDMESTIKQVQEKKLDLRNAQTAMSGYLQQAILAIARLIQNLYKSIETDLRGPEMLYKSKKRGIDIKQTKEETTKQQEYNKKMRAFFISIAQNFPALKQANEAARKAIINFTQTKKFNPTDIVTVTQLYETILKEFNTAYSTNNIPISFGTKTNYVSIALRQLMNFYFNDISTTLKIAGYVGNELTRKKESKLPYYAFYYNLSQRINGSDKGTSLVISKGYEGQIEAFAKQFFPGSSQMVIQYFKQKKKAMSVDAFGNALWDLSVNELDPNQEAVVYALAIYKEVMADIAMLAQDQIERSAKQANGYMAAIYLNRAQATFKKMVPKKDNSSLLDIVIDAYQQASNYFEKAGITTNAQQYSNLANNLITGKQMRQKAQQAEKQKNINQAVLLYQQAFDAFSVGGDAVDAAKMEEKRNELNAENSIKSAQSQLNDFIAKNQTQLQSYMTYISLPNLEATVQLSVYMAMLSSLSDSCKSALNSYKSAIASLEKLGKPIDVLEDSVLFLQYFIDGLKHLSDGDTYASLGTIDNLMLAEYSYYPQALFNARKADALYSKDLLQYVPIFLSTIATDQLNNTLKQNQQWNIELLFNRHCAKRYLEVAPMIEDQLVMIQYLAAADGTRMIYISPAMETSLSTSLEVVISEKKTFEGLLKQAEEKQTAALNLATTDWQQNKEVKHFYLSTADAAWQDLLKRFATLYRFSKDHTKVLQDFSNAIVAYSKLYQAQVPQEFYPSIGTAIIYYRQFVVFTTNNEIDNITNTLKTISNLAKDFFDQVKMLQKQVENPDLIMSATDNQKKIIEWKNSFEQAISHQNAVIAELAPKNNPNELQLFSIEVDSQSGDIVAKMQLTGQSAFELVTIVNPELKLADIYKKMGDSLYKSADYKSAYNAYYNAQSNYNKAGKLDSADQANQLYKKSFTRSIYHAYLELVVPNKTYQHNIKMVNVANISVPTHYELYNDVQEIPTNKIPLPTNLSDLANDKSAQATQQIQDLLLGYAYLLFLNKKLTDVGIEYEKVVKEGTILRSLTEIGNTFSKDELPLVINIVESANYYQKKLQQRIANKESSLHLLQEKEKFILAISYQPLLATTPIASNPYMTQKPYKTYYPADTYYAAIRALSDPNKTEVSYASQSFVSGSEKIFFDQALGNLAESNLASAGAYQRRLDYMMKGGAIEEVDPTINYEEMITLTSAQAQIAKLKKVKKDDFSAKITDYQQPLDIFKSYAKGVIDTYFNSAYIFYKQENDNKKLVDINNALSSFYISAGDNLQFFLIGDPQAADYFYGSGSSYGGLIVDIQNFYQLAYAFNQKLLEQAESKIATMYESAGKLVVAKNNYFGALPFYKFAVSAYHVMQSPDPKKFAQAGLDLLNVYFKGSMEQLLQFRKGILAPLSLSGESEKISLQDLIKKVQTDITVSGRQREASNMYHDALLDATIYFGDCSGWGSIFAYPKGKPESKTGDQDPVTKGGLELLNSYTEKNNISFDTASSVIATLKRPDFEKLMQNAFDSFSQEVQKATSQQSRLIGFSAIQQLTNALFFALGKVYMKFYLSSLDPAKQYLQWKNAVDAEKQNIVAPPEQWLGKQ